MSWRDLDLTFDHAVVILTFCPGNISETVRCWKLSFGTDIY